MLFTKLRDRFQQNAAFRQGVILAGFCLLAYAPFIPWLGFYGDDWGYTWLLYRHGTLEPFLRNNRFGFIPVYDALGTVLGPYPWMWQGLMVALRWLCGMVFWHILNGCWPKQSRYTVAASILFVIYPGFLLHFAAFNLSAHFIALACFLSSIWFNQLYLEKRPHKWFFLIAGMLLSAANLYLTEYFFFLELMRLVLLVITAHREDLTWRQATRRMIPAWIPFLLVFLTLLVWRLTAQSQINGYYGLKLLDAIRSDPLPAIIAQLLQMSSDIWNSGVMVFIHAILPGEFFQNRSIWQMAGYLLAAVLLSGALYFLSRRKPWSSGKQPQRTGWAWIWIGILWSLVGGWAIWLAMLRFNGSIVNSRFTLPFMPGAVLLVVGIVQLLFRRWPKVELILLSLLISGSILFQNLIANEYRRDWAAQKSFFTQLVWRYPDLQPGTMITISENPTSMGEENALSAATNWIYQTAPGLELDYYVYFIPEKFYSDNPGLQPGATHKKGHLVGQFNASLDKSIVIYLDSRGCNRTLYPDIDKVNGKLSDFIRNQTILSHPGTALRSSRKTTDNRLVATFGKSQETGWCWRYQQADMLAQLQDWQSIVEISHDLNPEDYSHDEQKLSVFITAYLETGDDSRAAELLQAIRFRDKAFKQPFCLLARQWDGLYSPETTFARTLSTKLKEAGCKP